MSASRNPSYLVAWPTLPCSSAAALARARHAGDLQRRNRACNRTPTSGVISLDGPQCGRSHARTPIAGVAADLPGFADADLIEGPGARRNLRA